MCNLGECENKGSAMASAVPDINETQSCPVILGGKRRCLTKRFQDALSDFNTEEF